MSVHNDFGKTGEREVVDYLLKAGYIIRETNWRTGKFELDIVATHNNMLVIVEVKSRKNNFFGFPEDAVTEGKIMRTVRAAEAYIMMFNIPFEVRFDIVTVVGIPPFHEVEHIVDAFYPPLTRL